MIELGAGTGIFTEYILKHILPGTKIIIIEIEEAYVKLLQEKFWNAITIEQADVKDIEHIRQKHHIWKIDLIVSWLPFLPAQSIHDELKSYLAQGTIFRTFTYQPSTFKKFYTDFPVRKIGFTWLNIPPTWVYGVN